MQKNIFFLIIFSPSVFQLIGFFLFVNLILIKNRPYQRTLRSVTTFINDD